MSNTVSLTKLRGYKTTTSSNRGAHTEGVQTIAQNEGSHAEGKFNVGTSPDTIHETGIGTSISDRRNAFEIYTDGTLTAPECTNTLIDARGNKALVTKEYVASLSGGSSELEKITENGNTGWRLKGRDPNNYGDIGNGAVDFSYSNTSSTTLGATGQYSFAEGYRTTASGVTSHTEGYNTTASEYASHAEGVYTTANGYASHAEGYSTTASGYASHAEGYSTTASGYKSHAEGAYTAASGGYSHSEGYNTIASANASHSEGYQTTANGYASHAEGHYTVASGENCHSEGYQTTANANNSHAEGYYTVASGENCHSEGGFTLSDNFSSHAEGYNTLAIGYITHAEGNYSTSKGRVSHSEGYNTITDSDYSHSEGYNTNATTGVIDTIVSLNGYSITINDASSVNTGDIVTISNNDGSYFSYKITAISGNTLDLEGFLSSSTSVGKEVFLNSNNIKGKHVQGSFNKPSPDTIHETGIGTSDTDRKNAFEIYTDGTLTAPECTNTLIDVRGNKTLVTKEYVKPKGGTTANRPADPELFTQYFDTDINKLVICTDNTNGANVWVDAMGTVS